MGKIKKVHKINFNITGMDMWRDISMRNQDRGLLGTMLSLPENWNFSIKGLSAILPDGEGSIRSTLNRLEELGYLKRSKITNAKGVITD